MGAGVRLLALLLALALVSCATPRRVRVVGPSPTGTWVRTVIVTPDACRW